LEVTGAHPAEQERHLKIHFRIKYKNVDEIQKSKKTKNPFFGKVFAKVKNGHKKVCPKFKSAKKFPKKKIFFIVTN
jgi:hypothetical protein